MSAHDARREKSVQNEETPAELGLDLAGQLREFVHSHRWTWASFAAHGVMLVCLALMPPKSSAMALDMLGEDVRYARYLAAPMEAPEPLPDLSPKPEQGERAGKAHEGAEGEAGKPTADKVVRRMGGGASRQSNDLPSEARSAGILGVLAAQARALSGNGKFESGEGFGYEPSEALGKLFGAELGDSSGFGSLGMRGTGRRGGGGVSGSISVGRLNTGDGMGPGGQGHALGALNHHNARVPRVLARDAEVRGSLSKETIRRVIQRHLSEVRFCYEEALRKRPALSGRVQVGFLIAPSGAVQQAHVIDSSLDSQEAERCIASAVRRWAFPAPDGGGLVSVRYPFLLEQAGD